MPWEPLIQNPASNSDRVYPTSRALSRLFADIAKMSCCSREPAQTHGPDSRPRLRKGWVAHDGALRV